MYEQLLEAAGRGATVLTGSKRLARALQDAFAQSQRDRGQSLWATPDILPLHAYLERCWSEWLIWHARPDTAVRLNAAQEAEVWRAIIEDSPEGQSLLRIRETAQKAAEAWDLLQAYRLPLRDLPFAASDDAEAFLGWAREFERRCARENWIEHARLPEFLAGRIRGGGIRTPAELWLAGFEELTPRDQILLDALGSARMWEPPHNQPSVACYRLQDAREELRAAAAWARARLEADPAAQIGIVVPALTQLRAPAQRILSDYLGSEAAFHISVGQPLAHVPLVHSALLLLEFVRGPLAFHDSGLLLRSPYLAGSQTERSLRALLEAGLRRECGYEIHLEQLQQAGSACRVLQRNLQALSAEARKNTAERTPAQWVRTFAGWLRAAGWPGDISLSSTEFQALESWNELLATFGSLDAVLAHISLDVALDRLRALAEETSFAPEDPGAPVQIMGLLEATGLHFDHLWVMGLHDRALPAAAAPNPFLPLGLQREHRLPHSSPEREYTYSRQMFERLLASAPDVVLSWPAMEGDQPLGASPFLRNFTANSTALESYLRDFMPWSERIYAARPEMETLIETSGPPLAAGIVQPGGTAVLKDMAACPFRAFARHRLGARPLESPDFGVGDRESGKAAHLALQQIWNELRTQSALTAASEPELRELIARSVDAALGSNGLGRRLEAQRVRSLLWDWLMIERTRPAFEVVGTEMKTTITAGGLQLAVRADRVDELPDGRRLIVDYKTGEVKTGVWLTERPDEPQVPLYCATSPDAIAGAAFGLLHTGDPHFLGISENGAFGNRWTPMQTKGAALDEILEQWRATIDRLATQFREGHAVPAPKKGACNWCGQTALCRIRDSAADIEAEKADES